VEMDTEQALRRKDWVNKNFDLVVVNYLVKLRKGQSNDAQSFSNRLLEVANYFSVAKGIFINSDNAFFLPEEKVLDAYDVIFKRESYRDMSLYKISEKNKEKFVKTMLSCTFFKVPKKAFFLPIFKMFWPKYQKLRKYKYDVFFCGTKTKNNNIRLEAWKRIKNESFKALGGLIPKKHKDNDIPQELISHPFKGSRYVRAINQSKINLALDGIGEFTFRHLEIWFLGGFCLSSPSIKNLDLPLEAVDGIHYVSFSDVEDLMEKIRYYSTHDKEREGIAAAGREMFKRDYNLEKYAQYFRDKVGEILGNKKTSL
jgi:hypothetical protein